MKRSSKLPLLAVIIALSAAFAFTPPAPAHAGPKAVKQWYQLTSGASQNAATNYMLLPAPATPNCPGSPTFTCAVLAEDDGTGHPKGIPATGNVTTNAFIDQVAKRAQR